MHGFKDAKSLHSLVGAELIQICVGFHEIIFHFIPEGTVVTVNAIEAFYAANQNLLATVADHQQLFFGFLGCKIASIVLTSSHSADIVFSSGRRLALIDDSEQYESIIIEIEGRTIIV